MPASRNKIVILEDESDRIVRMEPLLAGEGKHLELHIFDNAPDMTAWLVEHHAELCLVCLDHDLGPNRTRAGATFDPGTGRDVADCLALLPPRCPVVLHTTNYLAAPGMVSVLEEAGWAVPCVSPYGDTEWIHEEWIEVVRVALKQG